MKEDNMKDNTSSLLIGLILGIIIGSFLGYKYSEQQHERDSSFKIRIGGN